MPMGMHALSGQSYETGFRKNDKASYLLMLNRYLKDRAKSRPWTKHIGMKVNLSEIMVHFLIYLKLFYF